jgi:hypothetical protein
MTINLKLYDIASINEGTLNVNSLYGFNHTDKDLVIKKYIA